MSLIRKALASVVAACAVTVLLAVLTPAPAQAEVAVFSQASPDEPVATLTSFRCYVTRSRAGMGRLQVRSRPANGYKLSMSAPAGFGTYVVPYDNVFARSAAQVYVDGPGGRYGNVNGGPPGVTDGGSVFTRRGSFGVGVIAIYTAGRADAVALGGGSRCPLPKKRRR